MKKSVGFISVGLIVFLLIVTKVLNLPTVLLRADSGINYYNNYKKYEHKINEEPLKYLEVLVKLKDDNLEFNNDVLENLALRKDLVGYQSNFVLIERAKKQQIDASPYYKRIIQLLDSKENKRQFADYMREQKKEQEAVTIYLELLQDKEVMAILTEMEVDEEIIFEALMKQKQWQVALELLEKQFQKDINNDKKIKLQKQYVRVLGELGRYQEALDVFKDLLQKTQLDSDTSWWFARSLEGVGETKKAKEIYLSLGEGGTYRGGFLLQKEGKIEAAAEIFSSSLEAESLWRGAKLWEELGHIDKSLELYLNMARETGTYQNDAAYRAYILMSRNNPNDSRKEEMLKILEKYPAWMNRLKKETQWEDIIEVKYNEKPMFLQRVDLFKELGESHLADLELAIGERNTTIIEKLALGDYYLQQGENYIAVRWGIRALKEEKSRLAYELAYQRPYEKLVREAAIKYGIDPYLIWAVMREESHYRKEAVSWVGALGLMQIMPSTGKEITTALKVDFKEEDLLIPQINIEFGAYYISKMLNMFSGDIDKALAAYNGGPGNVRKWSKSKLGIEKEDFQTAIVFLETQQYTTKVKNSYYIYKWFYGE